MRDGSAPVDQHADLAPGFPGQLGEMSGEFVGDQAVGWDLPPEEALEPSDLVGLQPMGISEDADGLTLPGSSGFGRESTERGWRDATELAVPSGRPATSPRERAVP